MKIFVSPSKTFKNTNIKYLTTPLFKNLSDTLLQRMSVFSLDELKSGLNVSDKLVNSIYSNIHGIQKTSPAVHMYDGIFYKSLDAETLNLGNDILNILSAFYGVLRPFDGIIKYRLDFNQNLLTGLYDYWKKAIHRLINDYDDTLMIDLTSLEYSKLLPNDKRIYRINFVSDKPLSSVESKKMRGLFTRHLLINNIKSIDEIKLISINDYSFEISLSNGNQLTFIKNRIV